MKWLFWSILLQQIIYQTYQDIVNEISPNCNPAVNQEVRKSVIQNKNRGNYTKVSLENKAEIAKYAYMHGVAKATKTFSKKLQIVLKESSVDWKRAYDCEFHRKRRAGEALDIDKLPCKKRGRLLLLGER